MKVSKPHAERDHPGYSVIEITPVVQKKVSIDGKEQLVDDYVGAPYTYKVPRTMRRKAEIELKKLDVRYKVIAL